MKITKMVFFAHATTALLFTGCLAGENQQFFSNGAAGALTGDGSGLLSVSSPATPTPAVDATPDPSATPAGTPVVIATPTATPSSTPNSSLCVTNPTAAACDETPVVSTPGVVTILFTLEQIPLDSASLIVANAIKYASPVVNPKILFVKDSNTGGEDEGDVDFIKNTLLAGYNLDYNVILPGGLTAAEVAGYDLVIVSNPGYPLSDLGSLTTLENFGGGVILMGDDMGHGAGFDISALTGLNFENNGTSMSCNGHTYGYDNLQGYFYPVTMDASFLPGVPASYLSFQYGNDLDWTTAMAGVQVLASATAAPGTCDIGTIPAVVRHER
jgi:hypothetical protein